MSNKMLDVLLGYPSRMLRPASSTDAVLQSLAVQFVILVLNLGTGVLTARLLGPDGRGIFAAVTIWPMFFALIAVSGLSTALQVHISKEPDHTGSAIGSGILLAVLWGVAATALGVAVLPTILSRYDPFVVLVGLACLATVIPNALSMVAGQALIGLGRFTFYNASRVLPPLAYLSALVAFALAGAIDWRTAVLSLVGASAVATVGILVVFVASTRPTFSDVGGLRRRILSFNMRAAPSDLLATLSLHCDRLLLVPLIPAQQLGYYVVAFSLSRVVTVAMPALNGVLLRRMSRSDPAEAKEIHDLVFRFSFWFLALSGGAVAVASPWLLVALYGGDFAPVVPLFVVLLADAVILSLAGITMFLYQSLDRPGLVSSIQTVCFAAMAAGVLLATPAYGAMGAACAVLATSCLRLLLLWICMPFRLGLPTPRLRPHRSDLVWMRERLMHSGRADT